MRVENRFSHTFGFIPKRKKKHLVRKNDNICYEKNVNGESSALKRKKPKQTR